MVLSSVLKIDCIYEGLFPGCLFYFFGLYVCPYVSAILLFFFFHVYRVITSFCLFLVALGLHCCAWAFSSCGEWGLFFTALHRLLIVVVSSCCETQALGHAGLSCGAWEFSSCGLWVLECGLWCGLSSCGAGA